MTRGSPERPAAEDGYLERLPTAEAVRRAVRALNPFPGSSIAVDGRRVVVDRCLLLERRGPTLPRLCQDVIEVGMDDVTVRLFRPAPLTDACVAADVNP